MAYLKFYVTERQKFRTAENVKLEHKFACLIAKKLARHFKVRFAGVLKNPTRNTGHAFYYNISLPKQASLLMICHEIAHLFEIQKRQNYGHNKKLLTTIKRIVQYAIKMFPNWVASFVPKESEKQ